MTQATHTPGPFWYSRSATPEHSPQYTVYAENGDGRDLAIVKGDNAERDAILIAAAPDMLAALELMVKAPRDYNDQCHYCGADNPEGWQDDPCRDDCPHELAKAAIAKARGEG